MNKLLYNIPSPDDLIYLTTGNREDLIAPINTLKETIVKLNDVTDKLKEQNGISRSSERSGMNGNQMVLSNSDLSSLIYDDDYQMQQSLKFI